MDQPAKVANPARGQLNKEAPEGQKAEYMAALDSTVASVPAREYVFVITDANARIGGRGEGGGEADSKILGAYGRDVLNDNGKLLLSFAEDKKLVSEHFFLRLQKWCALHIPKRQPQQGTNTLRLYPYKAGGPSTDPLH